MAHGNQLRTTTAKSTGNDCLMKMLLNYAAILAIAFSSAGCLEQLKANHKQTVLDGLKSVPHISEIKAIFSNAPTDHFITDFSLYKDKPAIWTTEVYFGGRYIFTYKVQVIVDYHKNKIVKTVSQPTFDLWELSSLKSGGRASYDQESGGKFGEMEWAKIVKAHGDFSAAGIKLKTNAPVDGFDESVRGWREPRQRIE